VLAAVTAATLHEALGTEPATQLGRHDVEMHDAMLGWVVRCSCGWHEGQLRDRAAAEVEKRLHVHATRPLPVPSSSSETKPAGCAWCGRELHRARTGRPPRFCDTGCRQASHRSTSLPPPSPPRLGACGLLWQDCSRHHAPVLGHLS
jgi:hypothetical protein